MRLSLEDFSSQVAAVTGLPAIGISFRSSMPPALRAPMGVDVCGDYLILLSRSLETACLCVHLNRFSQTDTCPAHILYPACGAFAAGCQAQEQVVDTSGKQPTPAWILCQKSGGVGGSEANPLARREIVPCPHKGNKGGGEELVARERDHSRQTGERPCPARPPPGERCRSG